MSFASPVFFWALFAIVPLAAIYWLKVRPTRKPVTALFLYEKVFVESHSTRLFQRLRDIFSLLLMLLAVVALVFALTRPQLVDDERRDLVILIDHSASMSATDGDITRLERAKETAREIVLALNGQQRAAIVSVADAITFVANMTDNPRELLDAIDAIEPTERPLSVKRVSSLVRDDSGAMSRRVILISDACGDAFALPDSSELLKVGEWAANVGIVAADIQQVGSETCRLFVKCESNHDDAIDVDLEVSYEGNLVRLVPMHLEPGRNDPQVIDIIGGPGRWTASLSANDALACDNQVNLVVREPKPVRVQVDAADRYFFENSVQAFSQDIGLLQLVDENPDLTLSQASAPNAALAVIFQPAGTGAWWSSVGSPISATCPRVVVEDHPTLRFLDVAGMRFTGARAVELSKSSIVLVESEHGDPLIWQASDGRRSAIVVNMDPVAADFFLSVRFPVLIHGAITHLSGRVESLPSVSATGGSVAIPGARAGDAGEVQMPNGEVREVIGSRFGPIPASGFYELRNDSGRWLLAASLLNRGETALWREDVVATAKPIAKGRPPQQWLIALAVCVVLLECLLYQRRKVG